MQLIEWKVRTDSKFITSIELILSVFHIFKPEIFLGTGH